MIDRKSDTITEYVADISKDINEFKSTQIAGGKSFVNYSVSSSSAYDFSIVMNTRNKTFKITFTHELPDKYNIVDLTWFVRLDNSNVMDNPRLTNISPYTVQVCPETPQQGVTTWLLDCDNIDFSTFPNVNTHTFYFKFYFNGTTTGTFSASTI